MARQPLIANPTRSNGGRRPARSDGDRAVPSASPPRGWNGTTAVDLTNGQIRPRLHPTVQKYSAHPTAICPRLHPSARFKPPSDG